MLRSFVIKSGRRQGAGLSVGMAHHLVLTVLTNLLLGLGLGVAGGLLGIGGGLIAIPSSAICTGWISTWPRGRPW